MGSPPRWRGTGWDRAKLERLKGGEGGAVRTGEWLLESPPLPSDRATRSGPLSGLTEAARGLFFNDRRVGEEEADCEDDMDEELNFGKSCDRRMLLWV